MKEITCEISIQRKQLSGDLSISRKEIQGDLPGDLIFGVPGKSAYQYAVEAGYTGTEEEFAEKLAAVGNYEPGTNFETDETLTMEGGILSVNIADAVTEGDTRPVSSHAVYDEFSKAVALLKTI